MVGFKFYLLTTPPPPKKGEIKFSSLSALRKDEIVLSDEKTITWSFTSAIVNVVTSCFHFIGFAENVSAALAPRAGNSQPILVKNCRCERLFLLYISKIEIYNPLSAVLLTLVCHFYYVLLSVAIFVLNVAIATYFERRQKKLSTKTLLWKIYRGKVVQLFTAQPLLTSTCRLTQVKIYTGWSHQLISDLKRCLLFRNCLRWSSLKAVSVPTSVIFIGGLRGSTATSDLVFVLFTPSLGRVRRLCRGLEKFFPPILQHCYG